MRTSAPWFLTRTTALLAGAIALVLGCEPAPVAPPRPDAGLIGDLAQTVGLLYCSPLAYDSVTQVVGPDGGTITVGVHQLSIPAGALADSVAITAVAPSDTVNRVQLRPEGLTFSQPAELTMSYANCGVLGLNLPQRVAYTDDLLVILEYLQSVDNPPTQTVRGRLEHFSNYATAW